jgi:hypothetical protein
MTMAAEETDNESLNEVDTDLHTNTDAPSTPDQSLFSEDPDMYYAADSSDDEVPTIRAVRLTRIAVAEQTSDPETEVQVSPD